MVATIVVGGIGVVTALLGGAGFYFFKKDKPVIEAAVKSVEVAVANTAVADEKAVANVVSTVESDVKKI